MLNQAYVEKRPEFLANEVLAGVQSDAVVTALASGGFLLTWTDASRLGADTSVSGIKGRLFDANGNPLSSEFLINGAVQNAQSEAAVTALASNGFVVTWTDASATGVDADNTGVKAQIFNSSGAKLGSEFLVNTTTRLGQASPTITSLASGDFVIAWTDSSGMAPDTKGAGIRAQIYSASGTKLGGEFLMNSTVNGSQLAPVVTSLASGGFVATWVDGSGGGGDASSTGIRAQIFSSTGAKVGSEFLVNSTTLLAQDQPATTSLSNGNFVVVWRDLSGLGDTSSAGVRAQIFNEDGVRIGAELRINTTTQNSQDRPAVVATQDGGFTVSWRDNSNLAVDVSGFGIKAQLFDASGAALGAEFQVNSVTTGNQEAPALATLGSGALVAAWTDYSTVGGDSDGGIKLRMFERVQGTISDISLSPPALSETAVQNTAVAHLAARGALNANYTYQIIDDSSAGAFSIQGSAIVVTDSLLLDYEAAASVSLTIRATDTFGNSLDQTFVLSVADAQIEDRYKAGPERLGNQVTAGAQQQSTMTALSDGRYLLTWADGSGQGGDTSGYGIKAQIMAADGSRIGSEFLINQQVQGAQDDPAVVALASGGFAIAWTDASAIGADASGTGVKVRVYDASGAPTGSELLVNASLADAQRQPALASLANGGFVTTWNDASGQGGDSSAGAVKAQIFDQAGTKIGGEFLVNTTTPNAQDTPAVAGLTSGGFVIAWHDASLLGGDASRDSIKAQIFDAGGSKSGGEFLVNTQTAGNQQQPAVAALPNGGFVIGWQDGSNRGGDNDYFGIKLQIYDAAGVKVGGEIAANSTTIAGQINPVIAALSDGEFVVSWSDYSGVGPENGTAGIKAQIFTNAGARVGGEFLVNAQALSSQVIPSVAGTDGAFAIAWTDYSGLGGDDAGTSIKYRMFDLLAGQGGPPPLVAHADTVAGVEDQPLTIDPSVLLANDVNANNAPLALTGVAAISGGTVALDASGAVIFTPFANFSRAALFTYTVSDGAGATATGRVIVNVAPINDAPIANDDHVGIAQNGGGIALSALLTNDVDPDPGDQLTLTPSSTSASGVVLSLSNGIVDYTPGTLFRSLRTGQTATDSFTYTVADSVGVTSGATVFITVAGANDAPTLSGLSNNRINENAAVGALLGTISGIDPDQGDVLSYSLVNTAGGRFAIEAATGAITYTGAAPLDFETSVSHQIVARVTDGDGLSAEQAFTVLLNNLPEPRTYNGDNGANSFIAPTNDLWTIYGNGGNDVLTGNASADVIYGGAGSDTMDGAGGADVLVGSVGNDIYHVDHAGDMAVEAYGEGIDLVFSSIDFTMPDNIEKLTQTGFGDIRAVGNSFANTITGNGGNNVLRGGDGGDLVVGMEGADTLYGESGSDFLQGGAGADMLVGGVGLDELTGGLGADLFVLDRAASSAERDTIKDFTPGEDHFFLDVSLFTALVSLPAGQLPANAFINGPAALTPDHRLVYTMGNGLLYYDPDGSGAAAMFNIAILGSKPSLAAGDFLIG